MEGGSEAGAWRGRGEGRAGGGGAGVVACLLLALPRLADPLLLAGELLLALALRPTELGLGGFLELLGRLAALGREERGRREEG